MSGWRMFDGRLSGGMDSKVVWGTRVRIEVMGVGLVR